MTYQIVIPFVYRPYMEECIATIKVPRENILLIDNTSQNIGVAASWNKGIEQMRERGCKWLILLSASVRFGEAGMQDFIDVIEKTTDDFMACEPSHGWHCIAIRSTVFDRVGTFDENFYPGYFEDLDYGYRVILNADKLKGKHKVYADVYNAGFSHGTMLGKVKVQKDLLRQLVKQ